MIDDHAANTRIRVMTDADLERVLHWRNHPNVRRYMYTQHEISLDEHRSWFERNVDNPLKHLLIFELASVPRGYINFTRHSASAVADWGFYIAPDAPKGAGSQLGQAALRYAFAKLELRKVCGQALAYNEPSIRFHRRLGFQQEGVLRDQHFDGSSYHAVICFGLLASEWQSHF
jgi:UDP-4-amino-4,6-dideoxy-N-acetyl-beta-L-altrosamine N-acetyltransferase